MRKKDAEAQAADAAAEVAILRKKEEILKTRIDALESQNAALAEEASAARADRPDDTIGALLGLEDEARTAAAEWPDGPNSDAMKAALRNASHGIAHIRKTIDHLGRINVSA